MIFDRTASFENTGRRGLDQFRQNPPDCDRGRKRLSPSPPSEPCVRFSRTRLSSRWFPHRDWLASFQAASMVNSPWAAKNVFGQR
jgi:hypothetical protein